MKAKVDGRYLVPGLIRGLGVLRQMSANHGPVTLSSLAQALGLSRAATYRLIYTLEHEGYVVRDETTKAYRLSARVLELGFDYLSSIDITKLAEPHLQSLSASLGANAHLGILEGHEVVYVLRVVARTRLVSNIQVGSRFPVHANAMGRMLVAGLSGDGVAAVHERLKNQEPPIPGLASLKAFMHVAENDAHRGYVVQSSVHNPGMLSIAAAVRDQSGATVAAINTVGAEAAMRKLGVESKLVMAVRQAAMEISKALGFRDKVRGQRSA
jgi:DNA-binding IclR family transcriptional regulator